MYYPPLIGGVGGVGGVGSSKKQSKKKPNEGMQNLSKAPGSKRYLLDGKLRGKESYQASIDSGDLDVDSTHAFRSDKKRASRDRQSKVSGTTFDSRHDIFDVYQPNPVDHTPWQI